LLVSRLERRSERIEERRKEELNEESDWRDAKSGGGRD